LIKGERIGVGASTMEASAALRTLVRRDSGKGYREMLSRRHAPGLVARPGQRAQALSDPRCRVQPEIANAIAGRGGDAPGIAIASDRLLAILQPDGVFIVMMFFAADNQCAAFAVMIRPIPLG
jgi:hypothetical protein